MANSKRRTVEFPEPMAAEIRAAVEAGDDASTGEAVRDAVRLWSRSRQAQDAEQDRLRHAWDAGKASGVHGPLGFDALRREGRRRLEAARDRTGHAG